MKELLLRYNFLLCSICLLICSVGQAQMLIVQNDLGEALTGVEVFTQDLSFATTTDLNGQIDLSPIKSQNVWLNFRYLGYKDKVLTLQEIELQDHLVILYTDYELLDEIFVLGRKSVQASEIPFQIATIDQSEISSTNPQTSADALAQHGGIYVQKSQMGGGSPVIRGFEANRVLLVVDDIRLNNAIYRSGHLQNAITVDHAMLDRMEVVFGPNSLMYGSDALGGVVHFKTRQPALATETGPRIQHGYAARYASANHEKSLHYDISYGQKKWGSLTSVTVVDYDDLRTGSRRDARYPDFGKRLTIQSFDEQGQDIEISNPTPNIQVGTGYHQIDALQKFLIETSADSRLTMNLQYSTSSDVPRYDNLSESIEGRLRWADWYYGPQRRVMAAMDYRLFAQTKMYDQLTLIAAYQKIDEDRITRLFGSTSEQTQKEDVQVWSFTADASKDLGTNGVWSLQYGADIQYNDVHSTAWLTDVVSGDKTLEALSRYANDANQLTNTGLYTYIKGDLSDDLHISGGLRYSTSSYHLQYDPDNSLIDWPVEFYTGVSGTNSALTGSLGMTWQFANRWQLRSMLSTAFRSPNIDDLAKIRVNSGEITFPNVNLGPEQSKNAEVTLAYQLGKKLQVSATGFYTGLDDAIARKSFTLPDGSTTWVAQGETLAIVANQNVESARIMGFSANIRGESVDWTYGASLNVTNGKELIDGEAVRPFAHIPPTYGKISLGYKKDLWSIQGVLRYNAAKPLSEYGGSADNPDLATADGALAWRTINLYGNYALLEGLELSLGIENITDTHYRPFAAGVSAPGRNIILSVRGQIGN